PCGLRVELEVVVLAVAEVAGEAFAHDSTARRLASRLLVAHGIDKRFAVDRDAECVTAGASGVDPCERTCLQVEACPEGGSERNESELAPEPGVGRVTRGCRRWQSLATISDQAEHSGLVLRDLRGGVGHDRDVDTGKLPGLPAVPAAHRLEVNRQSRRACGHSKGAAPAQRLRLREPGTLPGARDHLLVDE